MSKKKDLVWQYVTTLDNSDNSDNQGPRCSCNYCHKVFSAQVRVIHNQWRRSMKDELLAILVTDYWNIRPYMVDL